MPINDELGKRMKGYEAISKTALMKRCPVIVRIDGKAFHTFTRGFKRPFDEVLIKTMQETTKYLCENIQGCVLGYTQSDEITLVLIDYKELNTAPYFDYEVQKLCSIIASMTTMAFNKYFEICSLTERLKDDVENNYELGKAYKNALCKGAMFDARVFNIPKEEVTNNLYWRQCDASRNSIQMVGQAYFSHKELQNKNTSMIQDMLMEKYNINWNNFPTYQKRGTCVIKEDYFEPSEDGKDVKYPEGCSDPYEDDEIEYGTWRTRWIIDKEIPIFKGEGRNYIEKLIMVGE